MRHPHTRREDSTRYWPTNMQAAAHVPLIDLPQISDDEWERRAAAQQTEEEGDS